MTDRGAVCWESRLYGSERGWSATLVRMKYCGTVGKPDGKQRKQTSSYSQGSLQPTRKSMVIFSRIINVETAVIEAAAQVIVPLNEQIQKLLASG